jgi:hypothetical protein
MVDFDIINHWMNAAQGYWSGLTRYCGDFLLPYFISTHYFQQVEIERSQNTPVADTISAYLELMDNNLELLTRGSRGVFDVLSQYHQLELKELAAALYQSVWMQDSTALKTIAKRQADLMELIVETYPRAIGDIGDE